MLINHPGIPMIETVAEGIGRVSQIDAVFVGGATTCLYIDDLSLRQVRPTKDVDCTIEVASYTKYSHIENLLRRNGFVNVIGENTPLCRWRYKEVLVDIMPDDESVIGFTNSWYNGGRAHKLPVILPHGKQIFIFPLEYFLASKIEAFEKRGNNDYTASTDIEDIIALLDGITNLDMILNLNNPAVEFVREKFRSFAANDVFIQSFTGHIENADTGRAQRIFDYLKTV